MYNIGIIGIGAMGFPIAKNIINKYNLTFFDVNHDSILKMENEGGVFYNSPKELASNSDVIFLMVVNYKQCLNCLCGEDGILESKFKGILVIMSTISPNEMNDIKVLCEEHGISLLDCPVSGGVLGAQNGSLTVIVSGNEEKYLDIKSILETFCKNIYYVGNKIGDSQKIKAINQFLVALNIMATAEAFYLAENLNVDLSKVYDIVSKSSGNSYIFENRGRSLLTRDFDTGKSSVAIHLKDLRILNSITENMNLSDILNKTCLDFYENIDTDSKEDAISMIRIYERMEKEL